MKTNFKSQRGFGHVGLVVLVIALVAIGLVGYRVMNNEKSKLDAGVNNSTVKTSNTKLSSKSDIPAATQTLNNEQVDQDLDPGQLNSDVNSLL